MITKKVNFYWCEYCKKKCGRSAGHIKKHEHHCTMNPNRICRMCQVDRGNIIRGDGKQIPIEQLKSILPEPSKFVSEDQWENFYFREELFKETNRVLPKLREITSDCPACIMAALRQKGIPVKGVTDFNFTDECKKIWENINSNRSEQY